MKKIKLRCAKDVFINKKYNLKNIIYIYIFVRIDRIVNFYF